MHPLQNLFLYSLLNDQLLNYIIFEYMRATYKCNSYPPGPKILSLPSGMLLTVIFARFHAFVYRLPHTSASAITTSFVKLMQLHKHPDTQSMPQTHPFSPTPPWTSHLVLPSIGFSSSQPSSSFPLTSPFFRLMTFSTLTLLHIKVHQFHPASTNLFSPTNHLFLLLLILPVLKP